MCYPFIDQISTFFFILFVLYLGNIGQFLYGNYVYLDVFWTIFVKYLENKWKILLQYLFEVTPKLRRNDSLTKVGEGGGHKTHCKK